MLSTLLICGTLVVCTIVICYVILLVNDELESLDWENCAPWLPWFSKTEPEATEEKKVFGMTLADVRKIRSEIDDFEETYGEHATQKPGDDLPETSPLKELLAAACAEPARTDIIPRTDATQEELDDAATIPDDMLEKMRERRAELEANEKETLAMALPRNVLFGDGE